MNVECRLTFDFTGPAVGKNNPFWIGATSSKFIQQVIL
jgi:hypothetical protein